MAKLHLMENTVITFYHSHFNMVWFVGSLSSSSFIISPTQQQSFWNWSLS